MIRYCSFTMHSIITLKKLKGQLVNSLLSNMSCFFWGQEECFQAVTYNHDFECNCSDDVRKSLKVEKTVVFSKDDALDLGN